MKTGSHQRAVSLQWRRQQAGPDCTRVTSCTSQAKLGRAEVVTSGEDSSDSGRLEDKRGSGGW